MGFWKNDYHRNSADEIEGWAYGPSGGPVKQWLAGAAIPLLVIIYGAVCLNRGYTTLPSTRGASEILKNTEGIALACSYIAFGAFLHFHYFWGLHDRLYQFSEILKTLALLVAIPLLLFAVGNNFLDGW